MTDKPSLKMKTRLTIWLCLPVLAILVYMIWGIWKVSIKEGEKWRELASSQQLKSTVVTASRGNMYDAKGNVLAQSATVYKIYVDPVMLEQQCKLRDKRIDDLKAAIAKEKDPDTLAKYQEELLNAKTSTQTFDELADFIAQKLNMDIADVRAKLGNTASQYIVLQEEIEKTLRDEIEAKLTELHVDGIRGEPQTKRVYPQESLAAHILGYINAENDGVYGLEAYYDDYLKGVDGRVITAKDKDGKDIPYRYKQSYDVQNGNDLNLNIDINIQYMLEKGLQEAYEKNLPTDRVCGIIMDPKTGRIYAEATAYSYDPNDPSVISDQQVAADLAALKNTDKYETARQDAWSVQWKDKCVSELYFPGSVFKIITGSAALEEKAITMEDTFTCNSHITVEDRDISCWTTGDHGSQNLAEAMANSCNPAFVQIGLKLGADKFVKYFDGFGYNELTGIDLPGEVNSYNIHVLNWLGPVELATSAFGQTNKVTPIQMITAVAASINGGYVLTPRVVDTVTDQNGNIVKKNEKEVKRQIISEETSAQMREILKGVVETNKSSNCYIPGYSIGGKSGTSQKLDENVKGDTYVGSYCAFAPAEDPQVIMLVMVDHPTGEEFYGSQVAAPICQEVLAEVLPYMGLFPNYTEEELQTVSINVPNVQYYTVEEAQKTLEELGFVVKIKGEGETVLRQMPAAVKIEHGGSVVLYTDQRAEVEKVTVPSIQGLTRQQAKATLDMYGLNLIAEGTAASEEGSYAAGDQSYEAGTSVPLGTAVTVTFSPNGIASQ
ncbi:MULTISPECIES: penicillin-binding transpeptidase domain-containing protein [Ruminococcus]|uniref:Penicillin-binding protein, transpeptidase domain protein n=1 Tax=Ruminococcus albus 8 TaxID=246199 RepID=E9SB76_RUMAL|nr:MULTISPECIES: penicillin-binding transpeptidase domain-containing protein [Ruminococcus]EGC03424.1 penicillin-binding protein, transpeptidase domain protein [Ruminococcus albus 8]MBO5559726.1 PASTA domain-containing protein [Ruminococcus sp.]MCC3350230.1 PASTA domain-containing protein [Ruminococcus albus 8]